MKRRIATALAVLATLVTQVTQVAPARAQMAPPSAPSETTDDNVTVESERPTAPVAQPQSPQSEAQPPIEPSDLPPTAPKPKENSKHEPSDFALSASYHTTRIFGLSATGASVAASIIPKYQKLHVHLPITLAVSLPVTESGLHLYAVRTLLSPQFATSHFRAGAGAHLTWLGFTRKSQSSPEMPWELGIGAHGLVTIEPLTSKTTPIVELRAGVDAFPQTISLFGELGIGMKF